MRSCNKAIHLLVAIIVSVSVMGSASANPLDPIPEPPKWATQSCLTTIGRIVQHEVGNMDETAWRFVAEQVIYDIRRMGCENLTQWRWAIGTYYPKMDKRIADIVSEVVLEYPELPHLRCQFIGNPNDVAHWRRAGYVVRVDYRHSVGNLVLIGVNCG